MHQQPMQQAFHQQALALGLAALVTAGVLSGLLGLSHGDQAAHLAQQVQAAPQAVAVLSPAKAA